MGNGSVKPSPHKKPELLSCTICFNVFKVPRMLPCQHTFCEACLSSYITKTIENLEDKLDFPCPLCREVTAPPHPQKPRGKWARQFPKNRLIITLFEDAPEKSDCCKTHPTKFVDVFCETHVQIGCSMCLMAKHKSCDTVPLEEFIKGGKFKRTCIKNNDLLLQYKKLFEDMVVEIGRNLDTLDKDKTRLISEVKSARASVDEVLNTLEEKMIKDIQNNFDRECDQLWEQSSRCRAVINDVMTTIEQVHAAQANTNIVQKSETIVCVEEKLASFSTSIREEHDNLRVVSMDLGLDPLLEQIKALEALGNIDIDRSAITMSLPIFVPKDRHTETPDGKRHRNKHVDRVSENSVSGKDEHFFCNITSSAMLNDDRVVLVDDSNCRLKLFNSRLKFVTDLKLESNPLNIAVVSDTELVVTLPGKREIVFVNVSTSDLSIGRNIITRLDCWGIDTLNKHIVITTGRDGHSVILLDMAGTEMNAFLLTVHQDENIRCPVSVMADKNKSVLYVTCTGGAWSKGCVISMDLQGKLLNIFHDPDLDTPRSCAMDRHGKLYICGLESSTVYQVSQGRDYFRIFPSKNYQVVGPLHVNFLKNFHIRFILTEVASDVMKIFELPTQKYTK